ncbi:MAG: hypothetical protein K0U38_04530 [Epsilonproteobacteria bacterium]|nr:hypothetical protein [Campylobacterota bacterium]
MRKITLSLTLPLWLFAIDPVVVPDAYQISEDKNLSYIYSKEYSPILPELKNYQQDILNQYSDEFGFELDDTLHVGLASHHNQIANAFSTQMPFNAQLFYGAGAGHIDYFCFDSWLKTLLIHETAHNFQLNPKENTASKLSHKLFGNTPFTVLGFLPLFPLPNLTESSFVLEGNAVMNESRFGNGGRLYSGYALAEVIALAHANKITPELMYNETYEFPYGEKFYLVGGFFHQFLVKRYGVEKVNHYFKTYATQMLPFFTNAMFKEQFGKDFETLLAEFVTEIKKEHAGFTPTKGKLIAKSQTFVPMNRSDSEIYTLISDLQSSPKIFSFNPQTKKATYKKGAWKQGEVFKIENNYHTQASSKTSPTKIMMGLFDKEVYLKKGTASKVTQGLLPSGELVYFDLKSSLEKPHIYVGDSFYDQSNSSVHIDQKGNLYYFKQEGKKRTLYKNREATFSYEGHYGFVTDVDTKGHIYFIAASEHGSSAFSYDGTTIQQVTLGDDIIDFKLIHDQEALVATITATGYRYQSVTLIPTTSSIKKFDYSLEDKKSALTKANKLFKASKELHSDSYTPLSELHYSSLNQSMGYGSYEGFILNLQANFNDPLMQNTLSAILAHEKAKTVTGLRYDNQAHALRFGGEVFGVSQHESITDERDHGYGAYLNYPFLATGYWRGKAIVDYTKAYDSAYRKPMSFTLDFKNSKQFGISKYPNHLNALSLSASRDRDSKSYGATYSWMHDLVWQSYLGLGGSYLQSDSEDRRLEKGIRISDSWGALQSERSEVIMPTLSNTLYAKSATVAEASLYKVFDTPFYNFSFPLSLQRETLYAKHRYYSFKLANQTKNYHESTLGVESDILFLHKIPLPISFEWLYNADVEDSSQFRFFFSGEF